MWSGCSAAGSGSHLSQDPLNGQGGAWTVSMATHYISVTGVWRFTLIQIITINIDEYKNRFVVFHVTAVKRCWPSAILLMTSAQVMMMMNSLQLLQYTECEASEWVEELKCWAVFTVSVDGCSPAFSWRSLHCNPVSFLSTTVHSWKSTTGFYCERQGQEDSFWVENTEEEESRDRMTEFLLLHECWDNRKLTCHLIWISVRFLPGSIKHEQCHTDYYWSEALLIQPTVRTRVWSEYSLFVAVNKGYVYHSDEKFQSKSLVGVAELRGTDQQL